MARKKGSEKPKGFYKQGGRVKPITDKKGVKESDMKISVKGNNDTIRVDSKKPSGILHRNNQNAIMIPLDETNLWDNASLEDRLEQLRYLGIDANSKNGKIFIWKSYSELPKHIQIELTKFKLKRDQDTNTLRQQNKERMSRISAENRARVWNAMGGIKDIDMLNYEDSRRLWQEHGKYPYREFE